MAAGIATLKIRNAGPAPCVRADVVIGAANPRFTPDQVRTVTGKPVASAIKEHPRGPTRREHEERKRKPCGRRQRSDKAQDRMQPVFPRVRDQPIATPVTKPAVAPGSRNPTPGARRNERCFRLAATNRRSKYFQQILWGGEEWARQEVKFGRGHLPRAKKHRQDGQPWPNLPRAGQRQTTTKQR